MTESKANFKNLMIFVMLFAASLIVIGPISLNVLTTRIASFGTSTLIFLFLAPAAIIFFFLKNERKLGAFFFLSFLLLWLIWLSDLPRRNYAVLEGVGGPGLEILLSVVGAVLLHYTGAYLAAGRLTGATLLLPLFLGISLSFNLLSALDWSLLFSDDHPTFLFRLVTLKSVFPDFHSYNPLWNAGFEFRDYFASGALGVFLLFSPLIISFDPVLSYNYIVAALLFILPPLVSFICCRALSADRWLYLLSSVLALLPSTLWYKWSLSFGTLGFLLSVQLMPYFLVFSARLGDKGSAVSWAETILAVILISLMFLWPLSVLITPPVILFFLLRIKEVITRRQALAAIVLLAAINLPWMVKFAHLSKVESFLSTEYSDPKKLSEAPINEAIKTVKAPDESLTFNSALKFLRQNAHTFNPLLILFGIPGLILIRNKELRMIYLLVIPWLLALSLFGPYIKPQLELERFIVIAAYLLCLPCALCLGRIIEESSSLKSFFSISIITFCILSIFSLSRITSNRTLTKFEGQSPIVQDLSQAIKSHAGSGRVLFAGFVLHELGGGHIAPLPYFSGKPLIARSYKHDHWRYFDVIPHAVLKHKKKRLEEFFEIYNVTSIITLDRNWRDYFKNRPKLYQEVWHNGRFRIFKRLKAGGSYFYSGVGEILDQKPWGVILSLESKEAVLKFNYIDGLSAETCRTEPYKLRPGTTLTKLSGCRPGRQIKLSL